MKKVLSIFVVCLLSLLLVGCGCEKKKEKENNGDTIEQQIEKTISSLYTDDSKLVYKVGDVYKMVFYYKDNEITGLEHYYEYENEIVAQEHYNKDKEELKNHSSIKKIYLSGKYVVYKLVGEEYEGKTVEEVKNAYPFLIPVYEN